MHRGLIFELRIILVSSCIILEISICGGVTEVIKLAYLLFEVADCQRSNWFIKCHPLFFVVMSLP